MVQPDHFYLAPGKATQAAESKLRWSLVMPPMGGTGKSSQDTESTAASSPQSSTKLRWSLVGMPSKSKPEKPPLASHIVEAARAYAAGNFVGSSPTKNGRELGDAAKLCEADPSRNAALLQQSGSSGIRRFSVQKKPSRPDSPESEPFSPQAPGGRYELQRQDAVPDAVQDDEAGTDSDSDADSDDEHADTTKSHHVNMMEMARRSRVAQRPTNESEQDELDDEVAELNSGDSVSQLRSTVALAGEGWRRHTETEIRGTLKHGASSLQMPRGPTGPSGGGTSERRVTLRMNTFHNFQVMLTKNGVETARFGVGKAKTLHELWEEYLSGRLVLISDGSGKLMRRVDVLKLRVTADINYSTKTKVLVQTADQYEDGRKRPVNQIPTTKFLPDENWQTSCRRCLTERLELTKVWQAQNLKVLEDTYHSWEEECMSSGYPGLKSVYRLHQVQVQLLEPEQLFFVLGCPDLKEFQTKSADQHTHYWCWKDPDEVKSDQPEGQLLGTRPASSLHHSGLGVLESERPSSCTGFVRPARQSLMLSDSGSGSAPGPVRLTPAGSVLLSASDLKKIGNLRKTVAD